VGNALIPIAKTAVIAKNCGGVQGVAMKSEKLKVVRGSGNVFRDLGHKNADAEQFKAILAAEILSGVERPEHLRMS
jgi:hypothetical protein